jgi:hypothetical protein
MLGEVTQRREENDKGTLGLGAVVKREFRNSLQPFNAIYILSLATASWPILAFELQLSDRMLR